MRWILVPMVLAICGAGVAACLVDSRCVADSDCEGFEQCDLGSGDCVLECSTTDRLACSDPRPQCLTAEFRCVSCLERDHCEDGEDCINNECVPESTPSFALVDENSASPTFGETYELAELRGRVVLLFFADLS